MTKKTLQKNMNVLRILVAAAFAVVGATLLALSNAETPAPSQSSNAGAGSYSLTPSSGSKTLSTNFTVAITENSGAEAVNTVDVRLTYDAAKLNFVSVDNTGGVFDQCFEKSGSNGTVVLTCSKLGGSFTGAQKVGEVVFSPKVGSGSTTIAFANTSHLYKADGIPTDIWNQQTTVATYTLTGDATPTPTPTTTTPPTTSGGSSTSGGTSSGGTKKTTPSTTSAGSGAVAQNTNPTTSSEPTTQEASEQNSSGGTVSITVSDSKGKPVAGAKVTLNKQTAVTDASGVASFVGVAAGKYTLKASGVLGAATKQITIVGSSASDSVETQKFELVLKKQPSILIYIGVGVIAVLAGLLLYLGKRWQRNRPAKQSASLSGMVVNGKDLGAPADEPIIAPPTPVSPAETKPEHKPLKASSEVQDGDTIEEIERKVAAQKAKPATHTETKAKAAVFSNFMPVTGKDLGEQMIKPTKPPTDPL